MPPANNMTLHLIRLSGVREILFLSAGGSCHVTSISHRVDLFQGHELWHTGAQVTILSKQRTTKALISARMPFAGFLLTRLISCWR